MSYSEIENKLQRAHDAFAMFRKLPFEDRARMMNKAAEIVETGKETFARLMVTEMGEPVRSAVEEITKCAWACKYYAENAERFLAEL